MTTTVVKGVKKFKFLEVKEFSEYFKLEVYQYLYNTCKWFLLFYIGCSKKQPYKKLQYWTAE